jgi:hypothetical protein
VENPNRVFEAIQEGLTAEEVIRRVTDPDWDDELERQRGPRLAAAPMSTVSRGGV